MPSAKPDPRLNLWRDDLAAAHLRAEVSAPRFVEGEDYTIIAPVTALRRSPADGALQDSQLLYGEGFRVYEKKDRWAWGQATHDDYVGYVLAEDLQKTSPEMAPTHKVTALRSFLYREPDIKTRPLMGVCMGAQLGVRRFEGRFAEMAEEMGGGFIHASHIAETHVFESNAIEVARRFIGAPYFWGGRESIGLDCSALVQTALMACGQACPRDSDMQQASLGKAVETPKVGDVVFWKGHVGFLSAPNTLLHANAFHMSVVEEAFDTACARIAKTDGAITAIKRLG